MKLIAGLARIESATALRKRMEDVLSLVESGPVGIAKYTGEVEIIIVGIKDWLRLIDTQPKKE
jgi:hypothetical protein